MRVKYVSLRPAGTHEPRFSYEFNGEVITATYTAEGQESITDTFDFSVLPDGKAQVEHIETVLPLNPIVSAKRLDGELHVELLWYHGPNAPHEERYPEWQEVS